MFVRVLDQFVGLWEVRGTFSCIADPLGLTFVPASAARLPVRRQIALPSRFPLPLWSVFGPLVVTFPYFSEFGDFVKIELSSGRELDFEGSVPPNATSSPLDPLPQIQAVWEPQRLGGGVLVGKPEQSRGATACLHNAYRDPKRQPLPDVWEQDSELLGEKPCAS